MTKEEAYTQYEYEVALFEQWGDTNNITFDEWLQIKGIDIETKSDIPNDLEEAAKKFVGYDMDCDELRDYEMGIASFIAGAKWQKEQMMKEGNVILTEEDFDAEKEKSMEWGYNLCKEQMMKGAVEGDVYLYHSYNRDATAILVDIPKDKLGDKVRVIVLPKED